ncbi:hypothetical protein SAMN04488034_1048 [Salinimicrobium catena]|uniref:asparagine synthase (glutamine-hydrolyzing) n=1 Tax=Salinimicrobium catena TaxID=390640 RepID=A0A1H5NA73_9FLAO|nr:hypothetical protein [Salinimicrobium catena]SDL40904.1 hypothetical protein SAMN04488140_1048 [Salinimicrobium catena]SEE98446.1 hypothetical protein SAMN04488034_1048 [Salinimicrobium catena]
MKFVLSNKELIDPGKLQEGGEFHSINSLHLYLENGQLPEKTNGCYLLNDGYMRDLDQPVNDREGQLKGVLDALKGDWPLPENITGSFSALLIDERSEQISICTDHVNLYPLYYVQTGEDFLITNSVILAGIFRDLEFDKAGIVQRTLGREYSNIGSRTILEGCKRLLPGECRRYTFEGELISVQYDNRLFKNISEEDPTPEEYWKAFKKEVEYCLNASEKANMALSGGMDSRIAFGAIPQHKKLTCYTFGNPQNYESRIAARLANLKKADFVSCYKPELYFPSSGLLRKYTFETEGLELCSWLEITESVNNKKKEPLILGELCEALPARKISAFSSKEFRKKNFIKHYILDKDYRFTPATSENFGSWKQAVFRRFKIYYHEKNLSKFDLKLDQAELTEALKNDLDEIFLRIEAHELPYAELYDEMFSWYTYTRMRLSKQLLTANAKFDAYSPAMSLQMLRMSSSIHPNQRLNYRFIKRLFKENNDLKKFYKVPTNQAPLIPQTFPDLVKFGMWGFRSFMDQYFIKRLMNTKDISRRYRWFPSINWAMVYRVPQMEEHLKGYFKRNHLGTAIYQNLFQQAVQRKELKQWPFANWNIINVSSLNTEIDLIKTGRKETLQTLKTGENT